MKHYKAICFDFDYTLADCTDSIVAGFANGMTKLGHPVPDRETVRKTVGYMLEDAYTMLTGDESVENRAKFRLYFIEVAMERMGVRPEEMLFCGDTVMDAGAARNAGCDFAAVLNGTTPAEGFEGWPCVHIAPDLYDLAKWLGIG